MPLLIKRVIDGPIAEGDGSAVLPLAGLALALGLTDTLVAFLRRCSRASC